MGIKEAILNLLNNYDDETESAQTPSERPESTESEKATQTTTNAVELTLDAPAKPESESGVAGRPSSENSGADGFDYDKFAERLMANEEFVKMVSARAPASILPKPKSKTPEQPTVKSQAQAMLREYDFKMGRLDNKEPNYGNFSD